eukprot:3379886-Pleurochrysis_carterae.AAC.1
MQARTFVHLHNARYTRTHTIGACAQADLSSAPLQARVLPSMQLDSCMPLHIQVCTATRLRFVCARLCQRRRAAPRAFSVTAPVSAFLTAPLSCSVRDTYPISALAS